MLESIDTGRLDFLGAGDADVGQALCLVGDRAEIVKKHAVRHVLHQVEDVVHAGDELVNLLTIQRGDEALVEQLNRLVGDSVGLALDRLDVMGADLELADVVQHRAQLDRALQDQRGVLGEIVEEPAFVRHQRANMEPLGVGPRSGRANCSRVRTVAD